MNTQRYLRSAAALLGWSLALVGTLTAQNAPAKKRVAVFDFDYQTVHQFVYEIFGSDVDIGAGITTMLVTDLVRNGTYSVIERQALDKVLAEQNFQTSGRSDPSTAASIGKLLGVDAVIMGAITQFGRDDKSAGVSGRVGVGPVRLGGIGKKSSKAVVGIDVRIVDVQTGEILAVATGKGESSRGGISLSGAGVGGVNAGNIDMNSSNFQNTIIGEATKKATDALVAEMVAAATKIVQRKVEISGLVADVSGNEVTVNVGASGGVRNGETYEVTRPGREVKDPSTGRVIRRVTTPVGTLKITAVDADFATGQLTGGPAKVGDCVGKCPAAKTQSAPEPAPAAELPPPPAASGGVVVGGSLALPSGAWSWTPYQFRGTEHFKYDVKQLEEGKVATGYYVLDIQPAPSGKFRMKVDGRLGADAFSSTITAPSADAGMGGMGMGQLMSLGPIGMTLFNPVSSMFFMGHELSLGDGWSTSSGRTSMSFKVEAECQQAGVSGLNTVMRENGEMRMQSCVSPKVALPLAVTTMDGKDRIEMLLVEYRP